MCYQARLDVQILMLTVKFKKRNIDILLITHKIISYKFQNYVLISRSRFVILPEFLFKTFLKCTQSMKKLGIDIMFEMSMCELLFQSQHASQPQPFLSLNTICYFKRQQSDSPHSFSKLAVFQRALIAFSVINIQKKPRKRHERSYAHRIFLAKQKNTTEDRLTCLVNSL